MFSRYMLMFGTCMFFASSQASFAQTSVVGGDPFYCQERGLGQYFYCEPPIVEEETEEDEPVAAPPAAPSPPVDPDIESLEAFKEKLDMAMKKAVWNPSDENMYNYMQMQVVTLDKSEKFANNFERMVWQNPELSYQVEHPTNKIALQAYRAETRASQQRHMSKVKDRYGFYYFYSGSCAACEIFSPIFKGFSEIHDLTVFPISMDGAANDSFDNWVPDNGIAKRVGFDQGITPAVLLFDSETNETVVVSFGAITIDILEKRIFKLTGGEKRQYIGKQEG